MKTVVPPTFPFFYDKLCIRASSNTGFSPAIRRERPPKVLASFSPGDSLRFLSLPAPRLNLSSLSFSLFLHFAGQICISRTWSDENIRFWQSQHRNTHRGSVSLFVAFTLDMTNCRPDAQNDVKSIPRTLRILFVIRKYICIVEFTRDRVGKMCLKYNSWISSKSQNANMKEFLSKFMALLQSSIYHKSV